MSDRRRCGEALCSPVFSRLKSNSSHKVRVSLFPGKELNGSLTYGATVFPLFFFYATAFFLSRFFFNLLTEHTGTRMSDSLLSLEIL